ncbi:MAG TPA: hypothetical protein DCP31_04605 [Cyanobacteria bacterium UBA8543]|nr:hypothetical protein [Cyanobacteria bacterium UBA8543]
MKNFRQTINPSQQIVAALILTGILSLGAGMTLVTSANADPGKQSQTAASEMLKRPSEDVASPKQSRTSEVPRSVLIAVRREISNTYKIPPTQLRVVSSSQQSWPDGCLGLAKRGEICPQILIQNGWRIVMSNGRQNWTYRTDSTGRTIRLESRKTASSSNLPDSVTEAVLQAASQRTGLPVSELRIVQSEQITADGCLSLPRPGEACTKIAQKAWEVTVVGGQNRLVYRANSSGSQVRLNEQASNISKVNLPDSVANAVLQFASGQLGVPSSRLRIIKAEQQTWRDSCLGLPRPEERCMGTPTPGWRVTVEGKQQAYVYRTDNTGSRVRAQKADGQSSGVDNLPDSVAKAVVKDASRQSNLPVSRLRVTQAEKQDWPDSCLGISEPLVLCAQRIVSGWRVVVEGGRQTLVYRTNETGSLIKLEKDAISGNKQAVPIAKSELPPPLSEGVVFRAIATGGFVGRTSETRLMRDGTVIRQIVQPSGVKTPAQTHKVSRQQLRQFQELLQQQRFSQFNQLSYPAPQGAADYISVTLTSQSATTRYADLAQEQLPKPLQSVIQAWNQIANDK